MPDVDATIVSRILDEGGEIVGKTACEYLCFSGGSHTNATGLPVHNPWRRGYTTGGSSSGSGAVVAAGDVEMAIGCDQGADGLTVGVLKEGYGHPNSETGVDERVRAAVAQLEAIGATVREISIPEHLVGVAVWTPIGVEGTVDFMMNGNGFGTNWKGLYVTSLIDRYARWRERADELSHSLKYVILLGQYMQNQYGGRYYGKAQNISRRMRSAYDRALADCDVIVMPTLPITATPIPPADAPIELVIQRAHEMFANTAVFDATGHPALTVPCGLSDGLPVGLMLVGKHFDEATIYRAAHAYEQSVDWKTL